MTPIQSCIVNKNNTKNPVWFMRQAGRYLPEFREIRKENPNFIELCLNKNLTPEITLQPLKRFELDAAIIFSDILMLPYGLGQQVEFKKNYGPSLEDLDLNKLLNVKDEDFSNKLKPVYEAINIVSKDKLLNEKDLFGFIGAPWTIFVYMLNKKSPKLAKDLKNSIFNKIQDKDMQKLLRIIVKFLKIHIKNQVESGATIIQIFDSWAGLLEEKSYEDYIYNPTIELVNYTKKLGVSVICFPRNIKNYKKFCEVVNPSAVNIDYEVDPKIILKDIKIPIQGGLDPKILLGDKDQLKKEANKYLEIFKDHPYIFNLGHGVLPETDPNMVDYLIKFVKDFK
jgi:uroporphyrinogen decarboxylase